MMRTLLDFENGVLDLFENNRITIDGVWTGSRKFYLDDSLAMVGHLSSP